MALIKFSDLDIDKVTGAQKNVESYSSTIMKIVNEITQPYCKSLDEYVMLIRDILADSANPPTADELDDFCLNLSTRIYFASSMSERLGVREDISKAVYKEVYNTHRSELTEGTVSDKDSLADLRSQQEQIVNVCYSRAYKIVKAKVEAAQELLSSCKKVLTRRINEQELTRMSR